MKVYSDSVEFRVEADTTDAQRFEIYQHLEEQYGSIAGASRVENPFYTIQPGEMFTVADETVKKTAWRLSRRLAGVKRDESGRPVARHKGRAGANLGH